VSSGGLIGGLVGGLVGGGGVFGRDGAAGGTVNDSPRPCFE
jgi:hypothetical protein